MEPASQSEGQLSVAKRRETAERAGNRSESNVNASQVSSTAAVQSIARQRAATSDRKRASALPAPAAFQHNIKTHRYSH